MHPLAVAPVALGAAPMPVPPPPPGLLGPAATPPADAGWLESLLERAGLSASSAHSVVQFVARPLEVVLVLVVAAIVAHFGAKALRRALSRAASKAATRRDAPRAGARIATVGALVANVWRFTVTVVAIAIILGMLGVNLAPLLASATLIGATIGFGAQSLVRDYLSGVLLTMEDQFGIGDTVVLGATTGVVEDLSLRVTQVRAADGSLWHVPNGDIRTLANASRGWGRAIVDVPVPAGDPAELERAKSSAVAAAQRVAERQGTGLGARPEPEILGVVAADATTCTLRVALRVALHRRSAVERDLREALVGQLVADGVWPGTGDAASAGDVASAGDAAPGSPP